MRTLQAYYENQTKPILSAYLARELELKERIVDIHDHFVTLASSAGAYLLLL